MWLNHLLCHLQISKMFIEETLVTPQLLIGSHLMVECTSSCITWHALFLFFLFLRIHNNNNQHRNLSAAVNVSSKEDFIKDGKFPTLPNDLKHFSSSSNIQVK
jgi:hypothetical protein